MNAVACADWLRNHLITLSINDLTRINSVSTDTCSTMFSMWEQLERYDDFKHCLFIPCDSHGIQLLIKDVLDLPYFSNVLQQAQLIAKSFRKALLQLARLRDIQTHFYKHHQSFILSVITRWGTQFRLVQSVLKNKDALKCYTSDCGDLPAAQRIKQSALNVIQSREFWAQLELIRELLQPLDEYLKMSESGKSHLGQVLSRWLDILDHLNTRSKTDFTIELGDFMSTDNGGFVQRYQRQVKPIHVTAYYLLPETQTKSITEHFDDQIQTFFRRYTTSAADYVTICFEFESFRAQEPPFEYGRRCWTLVSHPKTLLAFYIQPYKVVGQTIIPIVLYSCQFSRQRKGILCSKLHPLKDSQRITLRTS